MPSNVAPALHGEQTAAASGALLRVSDLTLRNTTTGVTLVESAFLSLESGEVLGVVGESGSGKSPLLFAIIRLLARSVQQASGHITYRGEDLLAKSRQEMEEIRGLEMAMIVPGGKFSLNPLETAGHQIVDVLHSHYPHLKKHEARERAVGILRTVGIPDPHIRFHAYPHELSGGMAQRILIAKAMACFPRLLLGDEFTVGLDVTIQAQIMDHVHALLRERNTSMILTTSDLGIAANYCDTVAVMRQGKMVEYAPVNAFFGNPQHPYSKLLLAAAREARAQQHIEGLVDQTRRDDITTHRFVHSDLDVPDGLYRWVGPGHLVQEDEA